MMSNRIELAAVLFLLAMLAGAGPAQAQLAGLVHDPVAQELRAVQIDSANGGVTAGSAAVVECCRLTSGLVSTDGQQFFAVGTYTSGDSAGQTGVFTLDFDGETVASAALASTAESVLEYDETTGGLISMNTTDLVTGLQLLAIDSGTGVVTPFPTTNAGCCEVVTGVSELDAAARRLYFVGRQAGEAAWSVYAADLNSGVALPFQVLPPGVPGFMGLSPEGGTLEVMLQTSLGASSQLLGIDPASPGVVVLAEHIDGQCCLLTPGQTPSTSLDGEAWWLAGSNTALEDSLMTLTRTGPSGLTGIQTLAAGVHLMAVVVNGDTVSLDALFRDRFQL